VRRPHACHALAMVAIVANSVASLTCGDQSIAAREARRVFADAAPPGTGTCWARAAQRTAEAFETSCEFTLSGDWSEYKRWLQSRMESQYQARTDTDEAMGFSRGLDGDLYTVTVALTINDTAKSVRITFRAMPW
jgi:hypothetical protein